MQADDKVRIRDVAMAAGVSISTASNVLSGKRQVQSESGRRVLEAARRMGYVQARDSAFRKAVQLVIYRKHGRVVMDTPFFSDLIGGIEGACKEKGYTFCVSYVDQAGDDQWQRRLENTLADRAMPTLLLATEMSQEDVAPFRRFRAPLVVMDSLFRREDFNTVCIDDFAAGRRAGRALAEAGHRRVGLAISALPFGNALERRRGLEAALGEHGLSLSAEDVFSVEPTLEGALRDMNRLLDDRREEMPTALFAINDIIAVGIMRSLAGHGLRVPEDVSLVGMDNMPMGRIMCPALSTLDVPKREIGLIAVERLIRMAENPDGLCLKTLVGTRYIPRESVAPPSH